MSVLFSIHFVVNVAFFFFFLSFTYSAHNLFHSSSVLVLTLKRQNETFPLSLSVVCNCCPFHTSELFMSHHVRDLCLYQNQSDWHILSVCAFPSLSLSHSLSPNDNKEHAARCNAISNKQVSVSIFGLSFIQTDSVESPSVLHNIKLSQTVVMSRVRTTLVCDSHHKPSYPSSSVRFYRNVHHQYCIHSNQICMCTTRLGQLFNFKATTNQTCTSLIESVFELCVLSKTMLKFMRYTKYLQNWQKLNKFSHKQNCDYFFFCVCMFCFSLAKSNLICIRLFVI